MYATGNHGTDGRAVLISNRFIHNEVVIQKASIDKTTIYLKINNREMSLSVVYKSPKNILQLADIDKL